MKKPAIFGFLIVVCLAFIQCKTKEQTVDFDSLTKNYYNDKNELNPLDATQNGQSQFNDKLQFEMTDSFRQKQKKFLENYQKQLADIDYETLSVEQKNSFDILKWELEIGQEMLKTNANLTPMHQFWGTHLTITQFAAGESAQPFKTTKDYSNFLKRLQLYSVWLDSAKAYMQKGIEAKVVLPKALTIKLIPQFEDILTPKVEDNIFYTTVKNIPNEFSDSDKKKITEEYTAFIQNDLMPKYQKFVTFLKTDYLPNSRETSGIGSVAGGGDLYKVLVKSWTTTSKTPEEIHNLGLSEVARIKEEMEKVKSQVGFTGTLLEFFDYVRNKKELMPFTKPEEVIANFEKIHAAIKPNVDKLFSLQPKTKFEVRRTEAFRENTASAEYMQGLVDGSRPGVFYVPIPDVKKYNYYGDEDLFLHEAIPGHHFQISLQQENQDLPDFRKFNWFGAYGEGWALYTESLGKELGLYSDPYQYFGMLGNEMHRAIRLVVDTGLHSKGWTREQAINYSLENEAESEASIIAEVERYMAIPGQALSYKIGQLKILELREKAKLELKDKFDIKVFHQKVLESGVMPLALLEKKINDWITSGK
jgi:uncharacterized protein (DUF885 family)